MDREHLERVVDGALLLALPDEAGGRQPASAGEADVLAHGERQNEALGLAVLGNERHRDGAALSGARAANAPRLAVDFDLRVDAAKHAEEREQQLALPLAVESAEAYDLALPDGEVDAGEAVAP